MPDHTRRVALVTGGSKGIGAATVVHLLRSGWSVSTCSRNQADLETLQLRCKAEAGATCDVFVADMSSWDESSAFIEHAKFRHGTFDLLICNAATLGPIGSFEATNSKNWVAAVSSLIASTVHPLRAALPTLRETGMSRVLVLSGAGVGGPKHVENLSSYVVAKSALVQLCEVLATELTETGCTINAIAPGRITTEFMHSVVASGLGIAGLRTYSEAAEPSSASIDVQLAGYFQLLDFLISAEAQHISGRLLSAKWDSIPRLQERDLFEKVSSLFRIRRVDESLYKEVP